MIKLILQIYRFIQIPTQGFTGEPKKDSNNKITRISKKSYPDFLIFSCL